MRIFCIKKISFAVTALFLLFACIFPAKAEEVSYRLRFLGSWDGRTTGQRFDSIGAIFVDKKMDEIYILDRGNDRVVIVDLGGIPLYSFRPSHEKDSSYFKLAVDGNGRILLLEQRKIAVFDFKGGFKGLLDLSGVPDRDTISAQSIAVDDENNIYLGTPGSNARIIKLDPDGKFISQIESAGRFINVVGLAVDDEGYVFLDTGSFTVFRLNKSGEVVGRFGGLSSLFGGFSMPSGLVLDRAKGRILIVDTNRMKVIIFNREGKPLYEFGGPQMFRWPGGISVDKEGHIYVADGTKYIRVFEVIEDVVPDKPAPQFPLRSAAPAEPAVELVPAPVPVSEVAGTAEVSRMVKEEGRLLPVFFSLKSAQIQKADFEVLDNNAEWLKNHPGVVINIRGYADERGRDAYNLALSKRRAKTVKDYLIKKGIEPERLIIVPLGRELAADKSDAGLAMSRRVDFLVTTR